MLSSAAPVCRRSGMARFSFLLLGLLSITGFVMAQPQPRVAWRHAIGNDQRVEQARAVRQTPDGGYLVAGFTNGTGGESGDAAVVKLDHFGQVVWSRVYGGPGNNWFFALDVYPDGGFVVVGLDMTTANNNEAFLVRADAEGEPVWQRYFGGWMNDQGYAVTITADGGCAVAGLDATLGGGRYLAYLVRLNGRGEILWQNAWGVPSINVEARSVHECADGGFIITGGTVSYGEWNTPFDMFVVRTTADGRAVWQRQYGGVGNEFAADALCMPNGDFVIVGFTTTRSAGERDMCMMRIDAEGNRLWSRRYGGLGDDAAFSVARAADGGFVVGGYTTSSGNGSGDLCLLKTNVFGARQWRRTYGGPGHEFPWSNQCFQPTADGAFVLAGATDRQLSGSYDMLVIKTGPVVPLRRSEGMKNDVAEQDSWTEYPCDDFDDVQMDLPDNEPASTAIEYALHEAYPNPFNPATTISFEVPDAGWVQLQVYNLVGQRITTLVNGNMELGHHSVTFDGTDLPSGVYFCTIETNGFSAQRKMLLLK